MQPEGAAQAGRVLLVFGDSNTHGTLPLPALGALGRHPPGIRWPDVAAAALGPGWQVIAEGHPGRTTTHDDPIEGPHKNGRRVLPALLESHRPVDVVAILLGTNDLKARYALPAIDIALGVEKLAAQVRASNAGPGGAAPAVLLIAPVPITEAGCLAEVFAGGAAKSRAVAPALAQVAARLGVPFLDAGLHAATDPLDGVHLDAAAHAALGAAIAAAIRQHWP
jgi:lysophospholipase L1-like esterase